MSRKIVIEVDLGRIAELHRPPLRDNKAVIESTRRMALSIGQDLALAMIRTNDGDPSETPILMYNSSDELVQIGLVTYEGEES